MRTGWRNVLLVSAAVFFVLTVLVSVAGVSRWEAEVYEGITQHTPQAGAVLPWLSRLGSQSFIYPISLLLVFILPAALLRRWWLWVAVVLVASLLEGWVKEIVGRPRPDSLRPGFPSGHTAAAAAFFSLAAYLIGQVLRATRAQGLVWALAGAAIILVGLSRIGLRVHWPLDAVGGAALGLLCCAAAVWWHETHPLEHPRSARPGMALCSWIHRWREALPLPLFAVVFVTPPIHLIDSDRTLDFVVDIAATLVLGAGLALRAWTAGSVRSVHEDEGGRQRLVISGPYQWVRHPVYIANFVLAVGIVFMAENALGLILVPCAFLGGYRLIIRPEEEALRERLGTAYEQYCREVPRWLPRRWPNPVPPPQRFAWAAVRTESRVVVATGVLAVIAELSESMPHLLR